jgi:hypothetical protein
MAHAQRGLGHTERAAELAQEVMDRIGLGREAGVAAAVLRCELHAESGEPERARELAQRSVDQLPKDASASMRASFDRFLEPAQR